jgi:hypothetical protein
MKLEDILKAAGYTDDDIKAQEPLLKDARFRSALEQQYGAIETTAQRFRDENENWAKWHEEKAKPEIADLNQRYTDAVAEREGLMARLKLAEEQGFAPRRESEPPKPPAAPAFDPKAHNLPTWDDVRTLAASEGDAIVQAADLQARYSRLVGSSIDEYASLTPDGRRLFGMTALLQEARAAKTPLEQYVSKKFDFESKQAAIDAKRRADQEEKLRQEGYQRAIAERTNPNLRPFMPSTQSFIPRGADASKPVWDTSAQDRRANRVQRAVENARKELVQ